MFNGWKGFTKGNWSTTDFVLVSVGYLLDCRFVLHYSLDEDKQLTTIFLLLPKNLSKFPPNPPSLALTVLHQHPLPPRSLRRLQAHQEDQIRESFRDGLLFQYPNR